MLPALWSQVLQQRKQPGQHVSAFSQGQHHGDRERDTDRVRTGTAMQQAEQFSLLGSFSFGEGLHYKAYFPPTSIRSSLGTMHPMQKRLVQLGTEHPHPQACQWFLGEWKQDFGFTQEIVLNFVLKSQIFTAPFIYSPSNQCQWNVLWLTWETRAFFSDSGSTWFQAHL